MRGYPVFRLFILCLFLLGGAIWIARMDYSKKQRVSEDISSQALKKLDLEYRIRATEAPEKIELLLHGRLLLSILHGEPLEGIISIEFPHEGEDVVLVATWKNTDLHALEIELFSSQLRSYRQTFWAKEDLEDIIALRPR